ncbi:MAG: hypothetical protein RLZZ618_3569 [Pseudomonadota bacterium]
MYADWVASARDQNLWDGNLRQQIYLGDEAFVERMQAKVDPKRKSSREIPSLQRSSPRTLAQWLESSPTREDALLQAHEQSGISMTCLALEMNLSPSWVSRLIQRAQQRLSDAEGAIRKT